MIKGDLVSNDPHENYTFSLKEDPALMEKIKGLARQVEKLSKKYGGVHDISFFEYYSVSIYDEKGQQRSILYTIIHVESDSFKLSGELKNKVEFNSEAIYI